MNRKVVIKIHLLLAGFFLPYLLIMPLSGTLYLLGEKGSEIKTLAFSVNKLVPSDNKEEFFRQIFKDQNANYDFEYIKGDSLNFLFRPTTSTYYQAKVSGETIHFYKVEPNLVRRLVELHKGHGPQFMRYFEIAFGIGLILITLSGIWLAFVVRDYRHSMGIATLIGVFIVAAAIF